MSGRVQGVFFRDSLRRIAAPAGVSGWVRNRPDGRVEAWLEGDEAAVERVIEWCRVGPRHALVTAVDVEVGQPEGLRSFRIRP